MAPRPSHDAWSAVWERATASRKSPLAPTQATSWSGSGLTAVSRQWRRGAATCSPRTPMLYVPVTGGLGTREAPTVHVRRRLARRPIVAPDGGPAEAPRAVPWPARAAEAEAAAQE